jgi:hypothetical protein
MLGLQAGIPGLCIAHDSRTREMCEVMKVPFVLAQDVAQGLDHSDLLAHFNFDAEAFDLNRKNLANRLSEFLQSNGIQKSPWLDKII